MIASYFGEIEMVRLLLEHKANVYAKTRGPSGRTAIDLAEAKGHEDVRVLLRALVHQDAEFCLPYKLSANELGFAQGAGPPM